MLRLPCVYFPHAPQISGLLPRLPITFLLPAPPRSLQPFLPVPPTLGLRFLENAHLGSPADSPISGCPHPSRGVLTHLGVSSPVSGCPHPSQRVLTLLGMWCPYRSRGVLTRLGVSSPVLAYPLLLLSSAGTLSTCPHRRQGVPRGSTKRQMCNDPFFLPKQTLEVSSEMNILRHKSRFC